MEKLAEEVKLFEEMVEFMERVYISNKQVTIDDRNVLSMAYNKVNNVQRELCDVISSSSVIDVSLIVRDYRSKVAKELNDICKKVSNLSIKVDIEDYVDSVQHDYDFCSHDNVDDDDDDVEEINPYLEKKKKLILEATDYEQTLLFMDKLKVIAGQEQVSSKDIGILYHVYSMIMGVYSGLYKIIDSVESSSVWDIDVSLTINESRTKVQNELNYICNNMTNHIIKEAMSHHRVGYKAGHRPTRLLPQFLADRKRVSSQSEMKITNKSKLGSRDGEFWSDADPGFGYHDHSKRIKKQEDIFAQIDAIFRDCDSEDVGKGIEIQHASTTDDSSEDDLVGKWEPELVAIDDERAYSLYDSSIDDSSEDEYEMSEGIFSF